MKRLLLLLLIIFSVPVFALQHKIQPGAEQTNLYLPMLKGKRVGVFVNQTSVVGKQHLIDVLLKNGIHIEKIFVPEHGFRGNVDEEVSDTFDSKTHIPIVSLYGKKFKPTTNDLKNIDILLFDIQDVGVRFYTYISSLQKIMESALENNKPLIVLDRPNPNGFYVDGPTLDLKFKSFTGMQPIPFIYGMTIGEYAKMLVGENWLDVKSKSSAKDLQLTIIPCRYYTHKSLYEPPIKPSPNLPSIQSIYWYASIGLLEATALSVGRGTDKPFQYIGHPTLSTHFSFIPKTKEWSANPRYNNKICYGWDLSGSKKEVLKKIANKLQIKYLIEAYKLFPDKNKFINHGFNFAAGTDSLITQIKSGASEAAIRKSWAPGLKNFKRIRKKYLLYPDFE